MFVDLCGCRFGMLTVLNRAEDHICKGGQHKTMWLCRCDCGKETVVCTQSLKSGGTLSCGCYRQKRAKEGHTIHGGTGTRLYDIWTGMISRCYNKNNNRYDNYGGRGIIVCNEWKNSFEVFRDWATKNGYSDNLTIDRINVNGDYCPENCRWISPLEQSKNKSNSINIEINGETKILSDWAREYGIGKDTVRHRIKCGWDIIDALTIPPNGNRIKVKGKGEE